MNPRLEELVTAAGQSWEIVQLNTRREHYGKTTAEWHRRFKLHEKEIVQKPVVLATDKLEFQTKPFTLSTSCKAIAARSRTRNAFPSSREPAVTTKLSKSS